VLARQEEQQRAGEPDRGAGQLDGVLGVVDDEVSEVVVVGDVRADRGDGLEPGDPYGLGVGLVGHCVVLSLGSVRWSHSGQHARPAKRRSEARGGVLDAVAAAGVGHRYCQGIGHAHQVE